MNILFVCTGNTCRSAMAQALFEQMLQEESANQISVRSAGVAAGTGALATPFAVQALEELGIDLTRHRARNVDNCLVDWADLILTMTRRHQQIICETFPQASDKIKVLKVFVNSELEQDACDQHGQAAFAAIDVVDPFGAQLAVYRASRDELKAALQDLLAKLLKDE